MASGRSEMADLKNAIREMLRRGMTEAQVKENLAQMGVANPDVVFKQATETLYSVVPTAPRAQQPAERPATLMEGMEPAGAARTQSTQAPASAGSQAAAPSQPAPSSGEESDKLDDAVALLKSLYELNKKILETNRDILLRLK